MLVAAAVLPHPPALVPEVASGAAHELDSVRLACALALEGVRVAEPDLVVLVGGGDALATFGPGSVGSLAGVGVPMRFSLPGAPPELATSAATLPLSLTVAAWLLSQHEGWPPLRAVALPPAMSAADAASLGQQWAGAADRVAIVAMGDGSAALTVKAPRYLVDGAQLWQKRVTQALVDVDLEAIGALDVEEAAVFAAAGRPAWQVLAGAAKTATTRSDRWRGDLLADESPFGVAYVVTTWTLLSS